MELNQGDVFVVEAGSLLGRMICGVERFRDSTGDPRYPHAGIITSGYGETYEALWTVRNGDLSAYAGCRILIARYKKMTTARFEAAYAEVLKHKGQWYPALRLPLFYLGLARSVYGVKDVCSELQAEFLHVPCHQDGIDEFDRWHGYDPAMTADIFERWQAFDIVFKGHWAKPLDFTKRGFSR